MLVGVFMPLQGRVWISMQPVQEQIITELRQAGTAILRYYDAW